MNRDRRNEATKREEGVPEGIPGIIIAAGGSRGSSVSRAPRIHAFVWGGKVRPTPILPYGRWKRGA